MHPSAFSGYDHRLLGIRHLDPELDDGGHRLPLVAIPFHHPASGFPQDLHCPRRTDILLHPAPLRLDAPLVESPNQTLAET